MVDYIYARTAEILSEFLAELDTLPPTEETRKLKIVYQGMSNVIADKFGEKCDDQKQKRDKFRTTYSISNDHIFPPGSALCIARSPRSATETARSSSPASCLSRRDTM